MHQALFIPELLLRICELLHINSTQRWSTKADRADRRAAKVALASLASTCRSFYNPAINTLWASPSSLTPLVLFLGHSVSLDNSRVIYVRPPSEAQLSCFIKHARLVRSIFLDPSSPIDTRIFDDLLSLSWPPSIGTRQRFAFFPNLRDISWRLGHIPTDYLCLFLGPRVTALGLWSGVVTPFPMECTLDALQYHSPPLEKLDCIANWQDLPMVETWLGLNNFQNLTCVHLDYTPNIPQTLWNALSQFPHLKELGSTIPIDVGGERALISPLPKNHFPSLHDLTLHSSRRQPSFEKFAMESMPVERRPYPLRHLTFICNSRVEGINGPNLIHQMVDFCDRKILESFSLRFFTDVPDTFSTNLGPLLALPSLRRLDLDPAGTRDLNNDTIEEMARAWPNLEVLNLSPRNMVQVDEPRITIEGLIPLAQLCPHLWSISIAFDPELVVSEEVQHRVNQMTFRNSVIRFAPNRARDCDRESARGLAEFVRRLFPELSSVEWAIREDEDYSESSYDSDETGTDPGDGVSDNEGSMNPDNGSDDGVGPGVEDGSGNEGEEVNVTADVGVGLSGPSKLMDIWYHVNRILHEKTVEQL